MSKKIFLVLLIGFIWVSMDSNVSAQSKKTKLKSKKEASGPDKYDNLPSAKNPGNREASYNSARRSVKKGQNKNSLSYRLDKKVEEYHARMQDNQKRYKKMARLAEKPQYSDPSYFGHKRKPKKRPPGKKKLCKECSIIH
ncbi:hypothetical protein QQ020_26490 [Fulvivirgaceae bacterium BMA12]|uniref:Uncharacterized protein n=1 Tax=Agaribacillus aureus TaxID=3051825 RepID=A0ABT8LD03_9BACT|nr:hypothetical protein [Fulvivirgaceae bacterium BMA12]